MLETVKPNLSTRREPGQCVPSRFVVTSHFVIPVIITSQHSSLLNEQILFITKCDGGFITKCDKRYFKVLHVLQSATNVIAKCDKRYCKVLHVLQSATNVIAKCGKCHYKV